jgi:hypothetical protein
LVPISDQYSIGGRPEPGESWAFTLCRYDYSVDFEGPELSNTNPKSSVGHPDFHRFEDYAPHRSSRNGQPLLGDIHTHARDFIRGARSSRKG